ncbi:signal recognition particle-docking protein FtsY [Limisalsivibrio acetivorans]|uniref:signal recognition particle-docking protein FtsY n=1 Tax=Limisalsivibrio acetivorans TaxID=1304888 RepID=UPI0003B47ECF|nr:signal recognition particle-docking protein FtsY [Limisalsivibrio acetivorans]
MGFFDIFKKKKNIDEDDSLSEEHELEESPEEPEPEGGAEEPAEEAALEDESKTGEAIPAEEITGEEPKGDIKPVSGDELPDPEEIEVGIPEEELETEIEPEPEQEPEKAAEEDPKKERKGLFRRLRMGLSKTSGKLVGGIETVFAGKKVIDEELLEELEELFISADVGVNTSLSIIDDVRSEVSRKILKNPEDLKESLKTKIKDILSLDNSLVQVDENPYVVVVVGVNGTGKTTSIAKLARMFKAEGLRTVLAAGDTFRAAAVNQLSVWAERAGVPIVKQAEGSDPAAVIYDAVTSAKAKGYDVVIADTAGRLHNKANLMKELDKVFRVIKKEMPDAPHEVLLVLDATSGQNALAQAKVFHEEIGVTGIVLTKLDGTAKGGAIIGIVNELQIPVKFIGFGEGMDDLRPFDADNFVDALFQSEGEDEAE